MKSRIYLIIFSMAFFSCTHSTIVIKNKMKGQLVATHYLVPAGEKKILLDEETAPQSPYMQMIADSTGARILTLLNPYKNAIYYYDYEKEIFLGKTGYDKEGPNGIMRLAGYYIKNMDSIYVYNRQMIEVALTDSAGRVKHRIPLIDNSRQDWTLFFAQYILNTVIPIFDTQGKLIVTGFYHSSISSERIDLFRFTASVDMKTNEVEFMFPYPKELYGSDSNWEGGMSTLVYPALSPTGEIILSFPVSHNLYIASLNSTMYKTVYGGSNTASTIQSIDWDPETTPTEVILANDAQQDMYTGIRYDTWRKVYYRIILQGMPNANYDTDRNKKRIAVIIMDEQFNYMGETVIGECKQWNWKNCFVTSEGLNIEYISEDDQDENYMIFKIFKIEKTLKNTQ